MMTWLSEDPWPLASLFGLVALGFLVALRLTQQGQYLIRAIIALGLAALVIAIEYCWVTDNERVEAVVYSLAKAVERSDIPAVMSHFTPNVQFKQSGETIDGLVFDEAFIRSQLENAHFDFVRVRKLSAKVSPQARRGSAEFEVFVGGNQTSSGTTVNAGAFPSTWSIGLQETSPNVWKINEVRPIQVPYGLMFQGFRQRGGSAPPNPESASPHRGPRNMPGRGLDPVRSLDPRN